MAAYDDKALMRTIAGQPSQCMAGYSVALGLLMSQDGFSDDEKKGFAVLKTICSVDFNARLRNPFGDFNLDEGQTKIALAVYPQISSPLLRSRVADALWVVGDKSVNGIDIRVGKEAVEAYAEIAIDEESWYQDGLNVAWHRGLRLAKSLGAPVLESYKAMVSTLRDAYNQRVVNGGINDRFRFYIASLLVECDMLNLIGPQKMAADFEDLAYSFVRLNRHQEADHAFQNAIYMYHAAGDAMHELKILDAQISNSLVAAKSFEAKNDPRCAHIYDHALKLCLRMPTKNRSAYRTEDKLSDAKAGLRRGYLLVAQTMQEIKSPMEDVSDLIKDAEAMMEGLDPVAALQKLVAAKQISYDELEKESYESLQKDLSALLYSKQILRNGRVVGSAPAWTGARGDSRHDYEMLATLLFRVQFFYETTWKPAYQKMMGLYRFDFGLFKTIVEGSSLVAENHRQHFLEGLMLGVEGRFAAATAMLCPEIENLVRDALGARGCVTTSIDRSGFIQENGLSSLVECDELSDVFGNDVAYELRAFFCDHRGVNMRNAVAHGLKDDELFNSAFDFYVWLFALRLVLSAP